MKRLIALWISTWLLSCGGAPGEYDNNDLQLVTGYTAKDFCSCLFVMEQTEAYCRAWTKASPAVARIRIDERRKVVSASAAILWGAEARFVDAQQGCVLER